MSAPELQAGLCPSCAHVRVVTSARSRFLLCGLSREDARFAKYPPQPVLACPGWRRYPGTPGEPGEAEAPPAPR